jgi:hypothetical protein
MIERIVVLLEDFTLRWATLYICWGARVEVIPFGTQSSLVTSRDCNHITWFRNSASVSLLATLSHRTWIAGDFSSSQLSQKRSKRLKLHFLKIFLQMKNFFLIHLLYAKSAFNSDRKLYRERWCDQMRTWSFSSH